MDKEDKGREIINEQTERDARPEVVEPQFAANQAEQDDRPEVAQQQPIEPPAKPSKVDE